jgi:hypothetical protein
MSTNAPRTTANILRLRRPNCLVTEVSRSVKLSPIGTALSRRSSFQTKDRPQGKRSLLRANSQAFRSN